MFSFRKKNQEKKPCCCCGNGNKTVDNKKVVEDIKKSGLLDKAPWFINSNIQILLTGIDHSAELVNAASNKAKEIDKEAAWPRIEEKYFEEAAKELEIPDYRVI